MATITEKLLIVIDANSGGAVRGLKEVSSAASAAEKAAIKSGSSSGVLASGLEKIGISSGTAAKAAAVGIGVTAVAVGLVGLAVKAGIGSYLELAGQIRAVQRVTGASAEDSSKLAATLRATGTETDVFASAAGKLAKTLGASPDALKAFGVEAVRTKTGTVDVAATFLALGDAYRNTADKSQAALLASKALGKGYVALIPLLSRTRAEQQALADQAGSRGQILDQADLDKARNLEREMRNLKGEVEAFKTSIGKQAAGPLSSFLGSLSVGMATARNLAKGQGFTEAATNATTEHERAVFGVVQAERQLNTEQDKLEDSKAFEKQRSEVNSLRSALLGVVGAQDSVKDAQKRIVDATENVSSSRQKLNELLAKGVVDEQKVTSATRSLTAALHSQQEAQDRVIDLQKALNDLLKPATAGDLTDAALSVTAATLAQADAKRQLVDAEKAAGNAAAYGTADDKAKAATDLEKANLGVAQAARNLQKAEADQERVRKVGTPTTEVLAKAQRELAQAQDAVQVATEDVTQREQDLRTAEQPDASRVDAIASARKSLATAIDTQAQAVKDLPTKIEAEANAQLTLNDQIGKAPEAVAAYIGSLDALAQRSPEVGVLRDRLTEVLGASQGIVNQTPAFLQAANDRATAISRMASAATVGTYGPSATPGINGQLVGPASGAVRHAAGGIVRATPGGQRIVAGEAGHDEVILSTDPRYAGRNQELLVGSGLARRGSSSTSSGVTVEQHLHFYGDPDRDQVRAGASDGLAELERALRSR